MTTPSITPLGYWSADEMAKHDPLRPLPLPSVRRLPMYLRYLRQVAEEGRQVVSCTHIADHLNLTSIQVRKDLALTEIVGRPKVGYEVVALIRAIEEFLGWNNTHEAFLIGVGDLGRALLGYDGFRECGLEIVAAFDTAVSKVGTAVHGKQVLSMDMLTDLVQRMHINIGVLTVPATVAQSVADLMIISGMRAIWNFTPTRLHVPESIVVEDVRLSGSFAVLAKRLSDVLARA